MAIMWVGHSDFFEFWKWNIERKWFWSTLWEWINHPKSTLKFWRSSFIRCLWFSIFNKIDTQLNLTLARTVLPQLPINPYKPHKINIYWIFRIFIMMTKNHRNSLKLRFCDLWFLQEWNISAKIKHAKMI